MQRWRGWSKAGCLHDDTFTNEHNAIDVEREESGDGVDVFGAMPVLERTAVDVNEHDEIVIRTRLDGDALPIQYF
ncbi:hypothetical protein BLNAU_4140 [Blattamonas nauphoetae]|uniref:Uncharacterized protein n=1 Tax=Blattamonas nauphoetae TaxID=2049346 RepID=A0ABQ9YAK7_9EUKA|nr:hypothetical protein BLNAU_4140 [Blattamonas nauphoetae]